MARKTNTAKAKKVVETVETVVEPIVDDAKETIAENEEINEMPIVNDETVVELNDEPIVEEKEETIVENVIDEEIGKAIAEDLNKRFEDAKKKNMTNRMFGYLWNGQEMDW